MENASSENAFSNNWPKTQFLRDQKRRFPIEIFLITFSESPDLLTTGSFLMNLGLSKAVNTTAPVMACTHRAHDSTHHYCCRWCSWAVSVLHHCPSLASSVVALHPTRTAQGRVDDQCLPSVCACSVFSNTRYMLYRLSVLPHLVETGTY